MAGMCTTPAACVGWTAETHAGGSHAAPGTDGAMTVKKILALAAVVGVAGLTACSVSAPAPAETADAGQTSSPAASSSASASDGPSASSATSGGATGGAKEACERFNSLFADYAAVPSGDASGYEDIYLQAEDAKDTVAGDLQGLFASLSLLAIDHSSAAESGGEPAQTSKDAVRDAVFANSGTCSAEGVTLKL